jgi:hypothetical protein
MGGAAITPLAIPMIAVEFFFAGITPNIQEIIRILDAR